MGFVKELISKDGIDINQSIRCSETIFTGYQKRYYYNDDYEDDMYFGNYDNDRYEESFQMKNILYIAIEQNDIDFINILLARKDIDVNILTNSGHYSYDGKENQETPLLLAVKKENIKIIQKLLDHPNIDVNKKSIMRNSYLELFGRCRCVGQIRSEKSALYLAVENGYTEIVKLLLSVKDISVNDKFVYNEKVKEEKTLLHVAFESMHFEIIRLLLKRNDLDVNAKKIITIIGEFGQKTESQKTPLYILVELGLTAVVELLLKRKDIKINEKSVFTRKGCTKYVDVVVNYEGDTDSLPVEEEDYREEKTVLLAAVEHYNIEMVSLLLSHPDINVNDKTTTRNIINDLELRKKTQNNTSTTALHIAVKHKNVEIIQLLLNHKKINVNVVDNNNKRPVDLANDTAIKKLFKK